MNKEKIAIVILSVSLLILSVLYIKSLITIQKIYESSTVINLESTKPIPVITEEEVDQPAEPEIPVIVPIPPPNEPVVTTPPASKTCYTGGCSGQLCGDESIRDVATTCEWREEYACYHDKDITRCEVQNDGECGWTDSPALQMCLSQGSHSTEREVLQTI